MSENSQKTYGSVIVSWDFDPKKKDTPIMLVGRQELGTGKVDVINAFQGDEAVALYNKLVKRNVEADAK